MPTAAGVITGDAQELQDKPDAPAKPVHANVAPVATAVKVAPVLKQMVVVEEGETPKTGTGFTFILLVDEQPLENV